MDAERGPGARAHGIDGRPTCLTADPLVHGRAWCGTHRNGLFRTDDAGASWRSVGLAGRLTMAVAASPADRDVVWVGTEPGEEWRSGDAGSTWEQTSKLETLSSSSEWSFPPRPDTHHVRWIACHPLEPKRLWVAIEAGALVSTVDGGRTWSDRVPGDHGTPTNSRFTAGRRIHSASPPATDISKVTMPAPRGARPVLGSRSVTCAAWRSIRSNRRSSWSQRHPDRTPPMWPAARTAGYIGVSRTSDGSACATAGRNRPVPSRLCSAPA